jgi:putative acetyltransferase
MMSTTEKKPEFVIRLIAPADDAAVRDVIETVMPQFGAGGAGFAISDPEVKAMHAAYQCPRSCYFVVELNGIVCGGAGVAALVGADATSGMCELRKMYFLPALRGLGAGSALMHKCVTAARNFSFSAVYLETLTGMDAAVKLYERSGFQRLQAPLGNTGHFGCNRYYLLSL